MKIVVLDGYTENPGDLSWAGFEALGSLTVYDRTPFVEGNTEILRRARGAEAVIVNKTPLSAETIGALLPELRYIGVLATGFNVVDIAAAKAAGIPVCNIPTYGTTAVAQFAMALLLELCHHVADHSRSVKAGDWSRCPDFCYWNTPLIELAGKTFGVIGYGRIGQATARLAAAFGMEVLACDTYAKPCPPARLTTLEEVLEKSDVISLHCPLTPETQGIINRKTGSFCSTPRAGRWWTRPRSQTPSQAARLRAPGWMCWPWSRLLWTTRSWLGQTASSRRISPGRPKRAASG